MCISSPYLPFNTNSHLAGRWKQVSTQSQISSRHGGLYLTQDLPVKTKNNTQTLQHVNNCTSTKEEDERDYCHFRHLIILYLCVFTDVFVSNYNKAHESWSLSQKQRLSERNSFVFHSRAFWFQTCLFPTHHWNSLPKANISRKHRVHGDICNTLHFQEEKSDSGGKKKKRLGAGRSVRPKWGSVLLLDFLSFLQSWPLQTWFIRRAAVSTPICELPVKLIRAKDQFPSDGSICLCSRSVRIRVARNVKWDLTFGMDPSYAACVGLI